MNYWITEIFTRDFSIEDASIDSIENYVNRDFPDHYWFLDNDRLLHVYKPCQNVTDISLSSKLILVDTLTYPIEQITKRDQTNIANLSTDIFGGNLYFAKNVSGRVDIFIRDREYRNRFLTELISINCKHLFENFDVESDMPIVGVESMVSATYPGKYWYLDAKYQCHIFTPRYDSHKRTHTLKPIRLIPTEVYDSRIRRALNRYISLKDNEWAWINGNNVAIFIECQRLASFVDPKSVDIFDINGTTSKPSDCPAVTKVKNALDIETVVSAFFNLKKVAEMARPKDEIWEGSLSDAYREFLKAIDGIDRAFKTLNLSDKLVE